MDVQAAIVVDEAQPSELIQEETHAGPGGADHLGERFLTDLRNDELRLPVFAKVGQQQEHPRQPLFARIKELIDQVLFDPTVAGQQIRGEQGRKGGLGVEHVDHRGLLDPHQHAVGVRCGRRDAQGLPGQAALPEESLGLEDGDHRFFALRGDDGELHLPALDVEDGVGHIALYEDQALRSVGRECSAGTDVGEERLGIERVLGCHTQPLA